MPVAPRRLLVIAAYMLVWLVLTAGAPALVVIAAVHDLVRRNRGAGLRLLALAWFYFAAELLCLLLVGLAGLRWGIVTPSRERFLAAHYRLQDAWVGSIFAAVRRVMGLRLTVEGAELAVPGPIVVFVRHASFLDTLVPGVILARPHGLRLRYVLKKELRLDPCLDVVGGRLPNYFVDRGGESSVEIAAIGALARDLGRDEGVLIYPEGTRFTPGKRARALERLRTDDPARYPAASALSHTLPPRPGGPLALLAAAGTDVVFIAHRGLEGFMSLHDLLAGLPIGGLVQVWIWRVPAAAIPRDRAGRIAWLDRQWARVDRLAAGTAA